MDYKQENSAYIKNYSLLSAIATIQGRAEQSQPGVVFLSENYHNTKPHHHHIPSTIYNYSILCQLYLGGHKLYMDPTIVILVKFYPICMVVVVVHFYWDSNQCTNKITITEQITKYHPIFLGFPRVQRSGQSMGQLESWASGSNRKWKLRRKNNK